MAEEPALLVPPPLQRVAEPFLPFGAGLGERGERAAVHPRARSFDDDDLRGDRVEHGAVVADHQHRRLRLAELLLQPPAGRDVEVVVGLVEQEDVGTRVQHQIEHEPLALATREFTDPSRVHVVDRRFHDPLDRGTPLRLEFVTAEVAPRGQRLRVRHPRLRLEWRPGEGRFGRDERPTGGAQDGWCDLDQHLAQRRVGRRHAGVL